MEISQRYTIMLYCLWVPRLLPARVLLVSVRAATGDVETLAGSLSSIGTNHACLQGLEEWLKIRYAS